MCSLLDIRNIGKHYLVKSSTHPITRGGPSPDGEFEDRKQGIKRHYTEAFCMRKEVYQSLLKIADNSDDTDALETIKKSVTDNNIDSLCLTIKNYQMEKGLSKYIHGTATTAQKQVF